MPRSPQLKPAGRRYTRCGAALCGALALLGGATLAAGCAADTHSAAVAAATVERDPASADCAPLGDPRAYIEQVAARCRRLEQYTMRFTRSERRGLLQRLEGPERIQVWFRRDPFSVRMKWLDPEVKYGESTYVAGTHGNMVRFVTRWWSPPLLPPPGINTVDVGMTVLLGEARRPLTEFGLERMMDRITTAITAAEDHVTVEYAGRERLHDDGPLVDRLEIVFEPGHVNLPRQTLLIDRATLLPAGITLCRADGTVDSIYYYEEIDDTVSLADDDFLLDVERDAPAVADDTDTAPPTTLPAQPAGEVPASQPTTTSAPAP